MRTYYFDLREGIPIRDRKGLEFPTASSAIEHSKHLTRQMRDDPRARRILDCGDRSIRR